jgi:hypothetical protein
MLAVGPLEALDSGAALRVAPAGATLQILDAPRES